MKETKMALLLDFDGPARNKDIEPVWFPWRFWIRVLVAHHCHSRL
jgi:hypothetical protein